MFPHSAPRNCNDQVITTPLYLFYLTEVEDALCPPSLKKTTTSHVKGPGKAADWEWGNGNEAESSNLKSEIDRAGIPYSGIANIQRSDRPNMTGKEVKTSVRWLSMKEP